MSDYLGPRCNADHDNVLSERLAGLFVVGSHPFEVKRLHTYLPPTVSSTRNAFHSNMDLTFVQPASKQATSPLGVTAHASCTGCISVASTPMFRKNPCHTCSMHGLNRTHLRLTLKKRPDYLLTGCFTLTYSSFSVQMIHIVICMWLPLLNNNSMYAWARYGMLMVIPLCYHYQHCK